MAEQELNNFNTILTGLLPRMWTSQAGQRFTLQGKKEASYFPLLTSCSRYIFFFNSTC